MGKQFGTAKPEQIFYEKVMGEANVMENTGGTKEVEAVKQALTMADCAAIVEKYLRLMYSVAHSRLEMTEDVDEAVYNARLAFLNSCCSGGFQVREQGSMRYLATQVRWQCNRVRTRRRREVAVEPTEVENPPDAPMLFENSDLSADLSECIDNLPSEQRTVILLDAEGLMNVEIARQTQAPVGTVNTRLGAARERLRRCLRQKGYTR